MTAKPSPPTRLGVAGRGFWRRVTAAYEDLAPGELALLEQACRTLDVITDLEDRVVADGLTVEGSKEQLVLHPAIAETRLQRAQLSRLLDQLGLPADEESVAAPSSPTSRRAQRAAAARWGTARYRREAGAS